ncbi:MAG: serine/threonine protein kinase, partial [Mariniblastus sp.]
MNSMIDPTLLKRFLSGDATDEEVRQCELFLSDPANLDELSENLDGEALHPKNGDSLLETLRNVGEQTVRFERSESDEAGEMVEQIESLVPASSIGQNELNRVLSPAESEDEIGRIGRYRVIEFIAGGGMGLVFKAEDPDLQRPVCIKVLHPMLATQVDAKARFAREAKAAAKLRNTRIVTVLEVGEHRDIPFLVMQLLDGQSLREKLNFEGSLEPGEAKKLAIQISEGLRYAHGLGFLHRDIKPENIWVTTEGDIKLLDFGLARAVNETTNLTNTGTILGTPSYMSPEQVQGKDLDSRSDLFSVGSVIFEMLTGDSPFGKSNLFSTMMSVANDSLVFPRSNSENSLPVQMVSVVESLLEKSPEDRIVSAEALVTQLESVDLKSDTDLVSKSNRGGSGMRSGWVGLLGGVAGAAFLALALLVYQMNDKG